VPCPNCRIPIDADYIAAEEQGAMVSSDGVTADGVDEEASHNEEVTGEEAS
jgi:hypothetical protein